MDSDFTHRPSLLGVPALVELRDNEEVTCPHLITQFASHMFQRTSINMLIGAPEAGISHPTRGNFVQHPKPFDTDDTLSMACRKLLIAGVRDEIKRCKFPIRMCLVWSPTACSYVVGTNGAICEIDDGVALPARGAFEAAQLEVSPDKYPHINIADATGINIAGCPAHATREEIVAQAVRIVMKTGRRVRVVWSESETIYAELSDNFGEQFPRIKPCVIWSKSVDADPASWHAKWGLKYPHIVVSDAKECILFYPDTMTKEELTAKAWEIVAMAYPRVCVAWSSTESFRAPVSPPPSL